MEDVSPDTPEPLLASVQALSADLVGALTDRVRLFALELQWATAALGQMAALGALVAVLVSTAWLAFWVGFAAGAIALGLAWGWVVLIVLVINVADAGWAVLRIKALAPLLAMPATLRRLTQPDLELPDGPDDAARPAS